MSEPLPPLDESLSALLDAERSAPLRPDLAEMKVRARARVLEQITGGGGGGGGSVGPAPSSGGMARSAAAGGTVGLSAGLLLGAVAGVIVGMQWLTPPVVLVPVPLPVPLVERVEVPLPPPPAAPSAPLPSLPSAVDPAERALIEQARIALLKGDAQEALVTLMGHERRFPSSSLVEEREFLVIQALVALGRSSEADVRTGHFRQRFPRSVHLPALEAR